MGTLAVLRVFFPFPEEAGDLGRGRRRPFPLEVCRFPVPVLKKHHRSEVNTIPLRGQSSRC